MKHYLAPLLARALAAIGAPADTVILLDHPRRRELGDLSTGLAHRLATRLGRPAAEIAAEIVAALEIDPRHLAVDITPNGFINFRFLPPLYHRLLKEAVALGDRFGRSDGERRARVILHGIDGAERDIPQRDFHRYDNLRGSALAGTLARLLEWTGHHVTNTPADSHRDAPANPSAPFDLTVELIANGRERPRSTYESSTRIISYGATFIHETSEGKDRLTFERGITILGEEMLRFLMLAAPPGSIVTVSLDRLNEHSERNPLRSIQYAHAGIAGIIRHAASEGFPLNRGASPEPLTHQEEIALIGSIAAFPDAVARAARELDPGVVTGYLGELAAAFRAFHAARRIIGEIAEVREARMLLLDATAGIMRRGLELLGISAPERI